VRSPSLVHGVERGIGVAVLLFAIVAPALVSTPFMSGMLAVAEPSARGVNSAAVGSGGPPSRCTHTW